MDVLKVLIGIAIVVAIVFALKQYDTYLVQKFNRSLFHPMIMVLLVVAEVIAMYVLANKETMKFDNLLVLLILSVVILIGCIIYNIKSFGFVHGLFSTLIVFMIAFVIAVILIFIFALGQSKRTSRRRT